MEFTEARAELSRDLLMHLVLQKCIKINEVELKKEDLEVLGIRRQPTNGAGMSDAIYRLHNEYPNRYVEWLLGQPLRRIIVAYGERVMQRQEKLERLFVSILMAFAAKRQKETQCLTFGSRTDKNAEPPDRATISDFGEIPAEPTVVCPKDFDPMDFFAASVQAECGNSEPVKPHPQPTHS